MESAKPSPRAKWRSSLSAYRSVFKNVLDTADIVRDGDFSPTTNLVSNCVSTSMQPKWVYTWGHFGAVHFPLDNKKVTMMQRLIQFMVVVCLVASQVCCGSKCGVFGTGNLCNLNATLNVSPMQLNFGTQTVGTSSPLQNVTLSATGMSASAIQSITTSGDFSETNNCPKSLAPNTNCTVAVVFTPAMTGTRNAQLVITQNPSVSFVVGLTGTGQ